MNLSVPYSGVSQDSASTDVLVVGAGIIGLTHAALALEAGLSVRVVERDRRPVGASIRNFGHASITLQHGHIYDLALAGRRHWLRFADKAGFAAAETGSLVVAQTETELQVLREFAATRPNGQVTLLTAEAVRRRLHLDQDSTLTGGAFLCDDLRVDPRTTVSKLAGWLDRQAGAHLHFSSAAAEFTAGTERRHRVHTKTAAYEADHVFVCVGHDVDYLFPEVADRHGLTRCALQMFSAELVGNPHVVPAVLTGTSLVRHAAFHRLPSFKKLSSELSKNHPELMELGADIMYTQRPDGHFLLGTSHSYASTQPPFLRESTTDTLLAALLRILPAGEHHITERWQGLEAFSSGGPLLVDDVAEGLTVVSVTAAIGMTVGFGLAEENINERVLARTAVPVRA